MSGGAPGAADAPAGRIDDCWNRIGVHGDGSCVELPVHVHCRNCPVYSAAAIQVLDRERPLDENRAGLELATRLFAAGKLGEQGASQSAFVFRLAGEWLALPTAVLDEVAELRTIHSLPHRRSGVVLGLVNVRGELLVCVSLAQQLGIEALATSDPQPATRAGLPRLLVVRNAGSRLAFPVDEVHGTQRFDERDAGPVPTTVGKSAASYSKALLSWREHAVGLLDDQLLFHSLQRSLA